MRFFMQSSCTLRQDLADYRWYMLKLRVLLAGHFTRRRPVIF
ncbi:MAG: hypothetical protein K0R08_2160 [Solimicrobium sp.]|jgi:hypothetical protein|nr:hypothetical protein [Solimicrobium sp.]